MLIEFLHNPLFIIIVPKVPKKDAIGIFSPPFQGGVDRRSRDGVVVISSSPQVSPAVIQILNLRCKKSKTKKHDAINAKVQFKN
jgi:hypothetical protein